MIPEWEPAQEPQALQAWNELLRPIAGDLQTQAQALGAASRAQIRELVPDAFLEPTSVEQVQLNVEAGLQVIADTLARGADPASAELPAGLFAGATLRAERGFPLAPLMRAFRISHGVLTDWMVGEIFARTDDPDLQRVALSTASAWVFACVDALSSAYAQAYESARDSWIRSAAAVRTETLNAVLDGSERDLQRASARLGYELDRHHVAILAWTRPGSDPAADQEPLQTAIAQLVARAQAESSLLEPLGLGATRAWMGRRTAFAPSALAARSPSPGAPSVCLALGEPGVGLDGFCRSYAEAAHARRVASLGRGGAVTRYSDVELLAIATLDMERTRAFVARTLRGLAEDDDVTRRVAATLSIYLAENRSRSRAAKRLSIHENTVSYRIRQAEAMLERPVRTDMLDVGVALALLPLTR